MTNTFHHPVKYRSQENLVKFFKVALMKSSTAHIHVEFWAKSYNEAEDAYKDFIKSGGTPEARWKDVDKSINRAVHLFKRFGCSMVQNRFNHSDPAVKVEV